MESRSRVLKARAGPALGSYPMMQVDLSFFPLSHRTLKRTSVAASRVDAESAQTATPSTF